MATIKEIITQSGGLTKFCSKTNIPYRTAQSWKLNVATCKEWLESLIEFALLHGYDRHIKIDSNKQKNLGRIEEPPTEE